MYICGKWVERTETIPVVDPFSQTIVDTVPQASVNDINQAVTSASSGAAAMARLTAYDRYKILNRAAELIGEHAETLAQTITQEEGKILTESRTEVKRSIQTMLLSSEEAKRIHGETIPLDAAPGVTSKFGFTIRCPVGIIAAISPFNFPLNLVCHKIGPALAAGNAVILKPATDTPLSALKLTEIMIQAGLPAEALQTITGRGSEIGDALTAHPDVRKITFTGSRDIGEHICRTAGLKKVTMELGSNSPLIVMPDADISTVASATVSSGFANAGQVCISTQRILADRRIYGDLLDSLISPIQALVTGDPKADETNMGPLIRESDAMRINQWIDDANTAGARVLVGGERHGCIHTPTVVADVTSEMQIWREELFGPAVAVQSFSGGIDEAISMANDSRYGLSAGIFTKNIDSAMKFAREVNSGNLMINAAPQWRVDLMPYGGLKDSGMGKEGPAYAVMEMTELKMVVFHLSS